MKRVFCLAGLLISFSIAGFADIARPEKDPKPKKSIETSMTIKLVSDATEARLIIPKDQIKQLRAQLDDLDDDSNVAAVVTGGISRTQTIVSGLFMSLALVFGGIWFVRSGKTKTKAGKTLVILALVAGLGSAATFVYANAGPPADARSITGKMFTQSVHYYNTGWGKIRLETTNENNNVTLIVPNPPDPKSDE